MRPETLYAPKRTIIDHPNLKVEVSAMRVLVGEVHARKDITALTIEVFFSAVR